MRTFRKLASQVRFGSRKAKLLVSLIAVGVALTGGVVYAGWTPNRPVYDWNNPAQKNGSFDGPRMNAYINTDVYGDERAFFDARRTDQPSDKSYDPLQYPSHGSKEVILRTYVHNAAHPTTNANGVGVAQNAKVRIELPQGTSHALRPRSYISISNPAPGYPGEVTDTVELVDSRAFALDYVEGSARIYNLAHPLSAGGAPLNDSIVTSGASIGHEQMNGNVPGCFEFQAIVEIRVKLLLPESELVKLVRKAGTKEYGESVQVKPGEKVEWEIKYQNTGKAKVENVLVYDQLPPHLRVVPGSVRWIYRGTNGQDEDVKQSDSDLFNRYVNFKEWLPNGGFYLRFDTIASGDFSGCEVLLRNIAHTKNDQQPEDKTDNADVKIVKENCVPAQPKPEQPKKLPETGPGQVFGIFAATSAVGTASYHFAVVRRKRDF